MRKLITLLCLFVITLSTTAQEQGDIILNPKFAVLFPANDYDKNMSIYGGVELSMGVQYYVLNNVPLYGELYFGGMLVNVNSMDDRLSDEYLYRSIEAKGNFMSGIGAGIGYDLNTGWLSLIPHTIFTFSRVNPPGVTEGVLLDENYEPAYIVKYDYDATASFGVKPGVEARILIDRRAGFSFSVQYHTYWINQSYNAELQEYPFGGNTIRTEGSSRNITGGNFIYGVGINVKL